MKLNENESAQRQELLGNVMVQFHRFALLSGALVANYSSQTGVSGRDGEALLALWSAQKLGSPLTASDLAGRLQISRAAVTYLVDRLEKAEFVSREPSPTDRRRTFVVLTEAGERFGEKFIDAQKIAQLSPQLFATRSDAELETFAQMLAELMDSMPIGHPHPGADRGEGEAK